MRILVCGPRDWTDATVMFYAMRGIHTGDIEFVIHGGCRGVDALAGNWAMENEIQQVIFPAKWKRNGRAAGPIRNQQMLDEGKPDLVIAIQPKDRDTRGTQDMIRRARKAGVRVSVHRPD